MLCCVNAIMYMNTNTNMNRNRNRNMYMYITCALCAWGSQKRAADPMELKLHQIN